MTARLATASTWMLLAAIVVSGVTTFMFYPLVTLELLDRGVDATGVGIVLGLLSGVGQIASTVIARVNAAWGSRRLAVGGLVLRIAGLSIFATDATTATYAAGAVVASLGSGATALAIKTELMRTSTSRRTITLRSIAINIGALIGPSIGGVLYLAAGFATVVIVVVLAYAALVVMLLTIAFRPPENLAAAGRRVPTPPPGRTFLLLSLCVFGYWALYALWPLVVPLVALRGFGTPVASTWVYTGNAVLILMLQYGLVVGGLARMRSNHVLMLGFAGFIGCFTALALPPGPSTVVVFATLFTLAEMLVSPTLDEITGRLHPDGFGLTRAYGFTGTIGGVASLGGASAGGMLIERSGGAGGVVWLGIPLALLGIIAALALGRRARAL